MVSYKHFCTFLSWLCPCISCIYTCVSTCCFSLNFCCSSEYLTDFSLSYCRSNFISTWMEPLDQKPSYTLAGESRGGKQALGSAVQKDCPFFLSSCLAEELLCRQQTWLVLVSPLHGPVLRLPGVRMPNKGEVALVLGAGQAEGSLCEKSRDVS